MCESTSSTPAKDLAVFKWSCIIFLLDDHTFGAVQFHEGNDMMSELPNKHAMSHHYHACFVEPIWNNAGMKVTKNDPSCCDARQTWASEQFTSIASKIFLFHIIKPSQHLAFSANLTNKLTSKFLLASCVFSLKTFPCRSAGFGDAYVW